MNSNDAATYVTFVRLWDEPARAIDEQFQRGNLERIVSMKVSANRRGHSQRRLRDERLACQLTLRQQGVFFDDDWTKRAAGAKAGGPLWQRCRGGDLSDHARLAAGAGWIGLSGDAALYGGVVTQECASLFENGATSS